MIDSQYQSASLKAEKRIPKCQASRSPTRDQYLLEFVSPSRPTPPARRSQTTFAPTLTMRPSMRLPLREANFICSSCRIGATPRISPLGQVRHYASDSPGILERARRKLWGTDNPPGPADPYSGSQIMSGMDAEKPKADEAFGLEEGQALPEKADEALTWDGMPKIGYLKEEEWRVKGPKKLVDEVRPWYRNRRPLPFKEAAHQSAVEIGLMQLLGRSITVTEIPSREIQDLLQRVKIEGDSGNWGDRLRFANLRTMKAVLQHASGSVSGEKMPLGPEQSQMLLRTRKDPQLKNLSLADGKVKFAFFARLSKLTSQRIPDSIISSSTTIGEALDAQEALRKKNTKLTPVLLHEIMDKNGAAGLSNVKILDVRQTRQHNDEDFGRKKAIISALYKSGLINKRLGRNHQQRWMQTDKTEVNA
ncbi:Thiolase C-terminal [Penicillium cf. griseofulvum]|uniref:Large ribosomal subunit protein mL50 n=1 Tax=Penicillium cf. griseofulvum TaxID=2972120 RepID=A0A9W9JNH1_9EURO|nr:Thiolase C-terminal [Penicillium cf. griseofulvum]KAJ5423746.1 Thiolase C-terminal [Penicillium cf. griseofulvum]KAJ5431001.1 Thiolase C-terminal [Penicillium cf. griseofulvum]